VTPRIEYGRRRPMAEIPSEELPRSEEEWRERLSPQQYHVTREGGTERAFTGEYVTCHDAGTFTCRCCGAYLFDSLAKFDSGCGWPSFFQPIDDAPIVKLEDRSFGMVRTEVRCSRCDAHLGHVFEDAPDQPTGLRFCINSASLALEKSGDE
jgi:peptide-methionine (R)-S-oxide reductase